MHLGMLAFGILCQAVGAFFVRDQAIYAASLWLGILLAMAAAVHMYHSLDRGLGLGEAAAQKLILRDYLIRYALLVLVLVILIVTGFLNPLVVFLGYMSLKVSALIQPFTHKISEKFWPE